MQPEAKNHVVVSGSFDDLRSGHVRFLEEASRLGEVHVLLWSDSVVQALEQKAAMFSQAERLYMLQALRYVSRVTLVDALLSAEQLPEMDLRQPLTWAVPESGASQAKSAYCQSQGIAYHVVKDQTLVGFPVRSLDGFEKSAGHKKVVVTGCYDWLHSGHVRFFEEVSQLGDLYVVTGSDENVRLLKGEGHPLFSQDERRYMVQSLRYVKAALISTGSGWMDAEPEINRIRPDMYAVNEDGDKPEKREFCRQHGLEYVVLKRIPKEGLPRRESTRLRGF